MIFNGSTVYIRWSVANSGYDLAFGVYILGKLDIHMIYSEVDDGSMSAHVENCIIVICFRISEE